jgi:adenosylmethionine-8-amino-7-oxononanoate aminotransferase
LTALWHPFADMSAVAGDELVLVRGEGVFVWDEQGRRYLDGASSLWYANVGHGRREIAEAVAAQLAELETFHVFGEFANRPALEVAERLAGPSRSTASCSRATRTPRRASASAREMQAS